MFTPPILFMLIGFVAVAVLLVWQNHRAKSRTQRWLTTCSQKCDAYLMSVEHARRHDADKSRKLHDVSQRRSNPVLEKPQ